MSHSEYLAVLVVLVKMYVGYICMQKQLSTLFPFVLQHFWESRKEAMSMSVICRSITKPLSSVLSAELLTSEFGIPLLLYNSSPRYYPPVP